MVAVSSKMEASLKGAKRVGRKRAPQSKEIAKTMAGKFGARLAYLTERSGLTADELATKIGKSSQSVFLYFAGKAVPHIDEWPQIAKALGVTIKDLLPE